MDACSICGTDVRIANGSHRAYADALGRVPGHEVVGTVVEVGAGAPCRRRASRCSWRPTTAAGTAPPAGGARSTCASSPAAIGITEDGGFAEYLLLPKDLVDQGNLLAFGAGQPVPGPSQ